MPRLEDQKLVEQIVWTLCGEVEQIVTFEPPVYYNTALSMSKFIKYTMPHFYCDGSRVD